MKTSCCKPLSIKVHERGKRVWRSESSKFKPTKNKKITHVFRSKTEYIPTENISKCQHLPCSEREYSCDYLLKLWFQIGTFFHFFWVRVADTAGLWRRDWHCESPSDSLSVMCQWVTGSLLVSLCIIIIIFISFLIVFLEKNLLLIVN